MQEYQEYGARILPLAVTRRDKIHEGVEGKFWGVGRVLRESFGVLAGC